MNPFSSIHIRQCISAILILLLLLFCITSASLAESATDNRDWLFSHPKITNPKPIRDAFATDDGRARIIVHFTRPEAITARGPLDTIERRKRVRGHIRTARQRLVERIESADVKIRYGFDYIPAIAVEVTPEGLKGLAANSDIVHIEPDLILHAHTAQGIPLMQAESVRSVYGGSGVAIAIVDTGIDYTHSRLGGGGFPNNKVIGGYDCGDNDADPMDAHGHGTSCAGIAAGDIPASSDYIGGVASDARLYALKITTGTSGGTLSSILALAWEWCVTHKDDEPEHPILVISTSFGGGGYSSPCDNPMDTLTQAAENAAVNAGITIFASSGNDGYCDRITIPACISNVISVGAVFDEDVGGLGFCVDESSCADNQGTHTNCNPDPIAWAYTTTADQVTPYSNVSDILDLFAPAHKVSTTSAGGGFTTSFGGTSAACPYAAGMAAVMQSAAKASTGSFLTPAQIKERLTLYGDNITYTAAGITKPRPNLNATDIDNDGMPAGWEIDYFDTIERDGSGDLDVDGLNDLLEYQAGTFPDNPDSENDGMTDGWEVNYGLDPLSDDGSADMDSDQLGNLSEFELGTLPDNPDTDGDGHTDGAEVIAGTDPLDPDSFIAAVIALSRRNVIVAAMILLVMGVACGQAGKAKQKN